MKPSGFFDSESTFLGLRNRENSATFRAASDSGVCMRVCVFRPPTLQARVSNKTKRKKGERELGPKTRCDRLEEEGSIDAICSD